MFGTLDRKKLYWICQLGGWSFYVLLNLLLVEFSGRLTGEISWTLLIIFCAGIGLSQAYRAFIIRFNWLQLRGARLIPLVILACLVLGGLMTSVNWAFDRLMHFGVDSGSSTVLQIIGPILNFAFVFFFWTLCYFLVHYFENYKRAEIENLRWQAGIREIELNKLKSQLNPHFMFNAMNSIRALVDENPARAKDAVTQLSNLLRNTLQMGKSKVISFEEELRLVRDYIAIETVRLEERLRVEWNIQPGAESVEVPPLMLQTLVENGIKHGVARLPGGGVLRISAVPLPEGLQVDIHNSGHFNANAKPESGFGLANTKQRLELLYGDRAHFSIRQENPETVHTSVFIPKTTNA